MPRKHYLVWCFSPPLSPPPIQGRQPGLTTELMQHLSDHSVAIPSKSETTKRIWLVGSPPTTTKWRVLGSFQVDFMRKFGYVPAGDDKADFTFTAETLKEKLKLVQKFGALPQTGRLDQATLKVRKLFLSNPFDWFRPPVGYAYLLVHILGRRTILSRGKSLFTKRFLPWRLRGASAYDLRPRVNRLYLGIWA